nr:MAG TPA: hypothetical protein [Caudoviricetes sp.]
MATQYLTIPRKQSVFYYTDTFYIIRLLIKIVFKYYNTYKNKKTTED